MLLKELANLIELKPKEITEGSSSVYNHLVKTLEQAEQRLMDKSNSNSSYNIGGNYNAVVSGNVGIRHNYIDYGPYNSQTRWDIMLEIGNNIAGKDALEEAESVFKLLIGAATNAGAEVSKSDRYSAVVSDGDTKIVIKYAYARSFCWVGIMRIK
jgi:hypothetical protein